MSEEDEDEDEEEGKTAVQADEKMKNNKPGLHGALLLSWKVKVQILCAGSLVLTRCDLFQTSWCPGKPTGREFLSDTALWAPETRPGIHVRSEEFVFLRFFFFFLKQITASLRDPHTLVELSAFSAINRFQPFNVAVSSNVLLLMVSNRERRRRAHSRHRLSSFRTLSRTFTVT